MEHDEKNTRRKPLTAFVRFINDGRILNVIFLAMLGLTVVTVSWDYREMVAAAPDGIPGSQRVQPAPMQLPSPGDQTRIYLPKSMPLGPDRGTPVLPGLGSPFDPGIMGQAMKFFKGSNGDYSAVGTITPGTAERLQQFLSDNHKQIGRLFLHSPGGSVSDALAMAEMIRMGGITTVVPANGYCASSCPLVLSGGLYRETGKNAWVGVHQIYTTGETIGSLQRGFADAQSVSALTQNLLVRMEVDPKLWIFAMQTPPASLYVLTERQIRNLRLANIPPAVTAPTERPQVQG